MEELYFGLCKECYECRLNKYVYDVELEKEEKEAFVKKQLEVIAGLDKNIITAEFSKALSVEYNKVFKPKDYSEIKTTYNQKLLKLYDVLNQKVETSTDPLLTSLKYALIGNYIDFDAMNSVSDEKLNELLNEVDNRIVDLKVYEDLRKELENAKSLVYFIDNCGEIVLDKLFMSQINKYYPNVTIYGLVRKEDVFNDATMVDAKEVGLEEVCIPSHNGNRSNKIEFDRMDEDKRKLVDESDLIISKGQANAESLKGCNRNVYYILLCKCQKFANEFNCNKFDSVLAKELV